MFHRLRTIGFKLAFLAGVPVIGALLLALQVASAARENARTAEAIGSIEDLAELSARMTDTVDELQIERAAAALLLGRRQAEGAPAEELQRAEALVREQGHKTDVAVARMESFLLQRDLAGLPPRLEGDLRYARAELAQVADVRQKTNLGSTTIDRLLEYYGNVNDALIDATAALTRLSSDGDMLRALSSQVALMHVQECESREHAVLSHTFAAGEFAPGMYRYLVTLVTEKNVHSASMQSLATSDQVASYQRTLRSDAARLAGGMLDQALEVTEGTLDVQADAWFYTQRSKVQDLAIVEKQHARNVQQTAKRKLAESRTAIRYGIALVIGVVLVSLSLALWIGRSVTRSVLSLVGTAGKVQKDGDFSVRAPKTTQDEVGTLTDAFNEMLNVIQQRDQELFSHRQNLEQLVRDRTLELSKRNQDMRLVLDTVEQGLATLDREGCITAERSRAFDSFFGAPEPKRPFFAHIAAGNEQLAQRLEREWQQLTLGDAEGDPARQGKDRLHIGERHFALAYTPIRDNNRIEGALLTVSDVTAETAEAAAREHLEKELQLAQKLEGIGQLAAGVAHEINTPMQYVGDNLGFLSRAFDKLLEHMNDVHSALNDPGALSTEQAKLAIEASRARLKLPFLLKNAPKALHDSSAGIAHVSNIVRAMKSFAHVDGDEKTTGDLNQAIRDTLVIAQNEYRSIAVVETDLGALPAVVCFPGRLNQVLLNLIVNAAHAVADAKPEAGGKISVSSHAEGDVAVVTISDNGTGIPKHVQAKVFDPFFTTKAVGKGTGQGLSIARSIIVDAHGGTLSFETEPGHGTAFTVRLPIDGQRHLTPS
ncbi:MAG: nitrate- and nitrite sensing domain-containing protein [Polyangiaceae bacterium]